MSERGWQRWLETVLVVVAVYGVGLVVAGPVVGRLFDVLGFGMAGTGIEPGPGRDHVLLVYGVLGAVLLGWMLTLLAVVRSGLRERQRWAWVAVAGPFGAWFVVDTTFSIVVGSVPHAWFNLGFAAALLPPLVALRPERTAGRTAGRTAERTAGRIWGRASEPAPGSARGARRGAPVPSTAEPGWERNG